MSSKKSQGPSLGLSLGDPLAGLSKLGDSVADSFRGAGKAIESSTSAVVDGVGAGSSSFFRGLSDGLQGMADSAAGALNGGSSSSKA